MLMCSKHTNNCFSFPSIASLLTLRRAKFEFFNISCVFQFKKYFVDEAELSELYQMLVLSN